MPDGYFDPEPAPHRVLSKKASRRFLIGLIVASLLIAFLAAITIKRATENEAFQEEVKEMRRLYDPNFRESDTTLNEDPSNAARKTPAPTPDSATSN